MMCSHCREIKKHCPLQFFMFSMCTVSVVLSRLLNDFTYSDFWPVGQFDTPESNTEWSDGVVETSIWGFLQFVILFS